MVTNFWEGRKVLITGHTGFKGGWLALWLQALGADVSGYALKPATNPSLFDLAQVGARMTSVVGDIRDLPQLESMLATHRPEIILHLAAQPLVRRSYADPIETYSTNVMGTVNLLESVRRTGVARVVINVTSDKCYENRGWLWGYRENERMGGHDPYSSSKACSELITAAFRSSFFEPRGQTQQTVAIASARAGNVIGGGDWSADRLIPDILQAFSEARPVAIRNPHATRPWQHVLEPVRGYLLLAQQMWSEGAAFSRGWNFGPSDDDVRPVSWVVDRLKTLWGQGANSVLDVGTHPHEASYLKLDCSMAKARLGWTPKLHLHDALELTVAWYKAFLARDDMRTFTLEQIRAYEAEAGT
ncbi:MAG: CDP-glucose 4,6-dehydratase [Acidiferrobacteraceae bacterium]